MLIKPHELLIVYVRIIESLISNRVMISLFRDAHKEGTMKTATSRPFLPRSSIPLRTLSSAEFQLMLR